MSGPEGVPRQPPSTSSLFVIRPNDSHCFASSSSTSGSWRHWGTLEQCHNGELVCELRESLAEGATKNGNGVVIGRDINQCNLLIRDDRVSQHHCRLSYDVHQQDMYIEDWSTNGTFINGRRLGDGARILLHDNDRISFVLACEPELYEVALRYRATAERRAVIAANGGGTGTEGERRRLQRLRDEQKLEGSNNNNASRPPLERTATRSYKTEDSAMEDALSCPICSEILYKAVTIAPCGHSFCASCLSKWRYSSQSHALNCPLCQGSKPAQLIYLNHTIRTIVQAFLASHPDNRRSPSDMKSMDVQSRLKDHALPLVVKPHDPAELRIDNAVADLAACLNNPEAVANQFSRIQEIIQDFRRMRISKYCLRAVDQMREALTMYPNTPVVWQNGMSCLAFTSACADRTQRQSLFNSGLTRLIINAMRHFPDNVIVKWRCCDFIGNVVSSVRGATTDELLTTDAIRTIVEGMRRQPGEEKVVQAGTFALKVIGKLDEKIVRKQLWDEHKVVDMVTPLLKVWRNNVKIKQNVSAILELAKLEEARRRGIPLATLLAQEKAAHATAVAAINGGNNASNSGVEQKGGMINGINSSSNINDRVDGPPSSSSSSSSSASSSNGYTIPPPGVGMVSDRNERKHSSDHHRSSHSSSNNANSSSSSSHHNPHHVSSSSSSSSSSSRHGHRSSLSSNPNGAIGMNMSMGMGMGDGREGYAIPSMPPNNNNNGVISSSPGIPLSSAAASAPPSSSIPSGARRNSTGPSLVASPVGVAAPSPSSSSSVVSSQSMNAIHRPVSSAGSGVVSPPPPSSGSSSSSGSHHASPPHVNVNAPVMDRVSSSVLLAAPVVMVERNSPSNVSGTWNPSSAPFSRGLPPPINNIGSNNNNNNNGMAQPGGHGHGHVTLPALNLPRSVH